MTEDGRDSALAKGERVYLRRPAEADRSAFRELVETSRAFLAPWEPDPPPNAGPDHRFERMLAANRHGSSRKHVVCRVIDDQLLGCMNINNVLRGVAQFASLGYWIGAPHARQGFMTEALQVGLALSFIGMGLHRVEANIRPENAASIALVRRAGFRLEGYSTKYLQIAGAWADHERYALLAEEWTCPAGVRMASN